MSSQDDVNEIVLTLKTAVSSAINQKQSENMTIEIQELTKIATVYTVNATFRVTPFFGGRTGKIFAILTKENEKFEISNLKIEEKGQ
jgi:hypothetical protein